MVIPRRKSTLHIPLIKSKCPGEFSADSNLPGGQVKECETRFCLAAYANSHWQLADEDFAGCCPARHNQNRKYGIWKNGK